MNRTQNPDGADTTDFYGIVAGLSNLPVVVMAMRHRGTFDPTRFRDCCIIAHVAMYDRFSATMIRSSFLVCLIFVASLIAAGAGVAPAAAQETTLVSDTTLSERSAPTGRPSDRKSPALAEGLSIGGTVTPMLVPFVLGPRIGGPVFSPGRRLVIGVVSVGSGLTFGPALGHFYAGNGARAWTGIGLRAVGSLVSPVLFVASIFNGVGLAIAAVAGTLITVGSAAYDIGKASNSARQYNGRSGAQAQLAPIVGPEGDEVGLSLRVQL